MADGATFHLLQRVQWGFRSGTGYGKVVGVLERTGDPDKRHYRIEVDPTDRAAHKGEEKYRVHMGGDMHPWDGVLPQAVKDQAAANRK